MHMVIRVVVEAHGMKEAVEAAQGFFNNHLHYQDGGPFDYCTPMVEGHTVSGADRWIDYADEDVAFPLASDPGRAEVEDAWSSTLDYMEDNLETVWDVVHRSESIEEFRDRVLDEEDMVQYEMSQVGSGHSTDRFLYVQVWSTNAIGSNRGWNYLQELIEEEEEHEENRHWVVPLDVHY